MEALGVDIKHIAFQVVNLSLLIYILARFLYKPILDVLEKRRKLAQDTVDLKNELEQRSVAIEQERQNVLREAKKEADSIIEDAREKGKKLAVQIEKNAAEKAALIVQKGEESLKSKEDELRRGLQREVAKIAIESAEQVLSNSMTEELRQTIADEAIRRFVEDGK